MPIRTERSAAAAARLAERTDENVTPANKTVAPAVASEDIDTQSVTGREYDHRRLGVDAVQDTARKCRHHDAAWTR
jgi:hypothetical protein